MSNTIQERFRAVVDSLNIKFAQAVIAEKTGYSKTTVSEYMNNKEPSEAFLRTFSKLFEVDFEYIWTGASPQKPEREKLPVVSPEPAALPAQTMSKLAQALADQAEANKIQAAANDKYAEGFRSLSIILERMENKMARQDSQATLKIKIEEIAASLADSKEVDLLAAKHFEQKFVELAKLVLQGRSDEKPPSLGGDNRQGENDGGGHKPRKKRL